MATTDIQHIVGSLQPARPAIKFLGGATDDAITIDAFAVARVAANDAAGTFTAWINVADNTGDYAIISCGDTAAVEYLSFSVVAGKLEIECNDATTLQYTHTTTNIVIKPHRWYHVAVTNESSLVAPKFYVDGVPILPSDVTNTDETDNGTWFLDLNLTDDGSIGAGEEAGAAAQVREFKGAIGDVKYWAVELTAAQILADFKGQDPASITGTSADLTDHWSILNTVGTNVENLITAANDGTLVGDNTFNTSYSEFTSRLNFDVPTPIVVADTLVFAVKGEEGHAIVIKAA